MVSNQMPLLFSCITDQLVNDTIFGKGTQGKIWKKESDDILVGRRQAAWL